MLLLLLLLLVLLLLLLLPLLLLLLLLPCYRAVCCSAVPRRYGPGPGLDDVAGGVCVAQRLAPAMQTIQCRMVKAFSNFIHTQDLVCVETF